MNGLRVYTPALNGSADQAKAIFYSRRGSGPFYLWRYDQQLATWCPLRIHVVDIMPHTFSTATWKSLPHALRARLGEHYLE